MNMVLKRRQNTHLVCIDPKKKNAPTKVQNKAELIQELKVMKDLNNDLEEENRKNMVIIGELKEKLFLLQKEEQKDLAHGASQTDDADLLLCEECEFPAETLFELGEHMGEFHTGLRIPCNFCPDIYVTREELEKHEKEVHNSLTSNEEKDYPRAHQDMKKFKCKFCERNFQDKNALMKHNKDEHKENVRACWNIQKGKCDYKECWFSHETKESHDNKKYRCKICDTNFIMMNELHLHIKLLHTDRVQKCRNFPKRTCPYENSQCWFSHDILDINEMVINNEN